VALRFAVSCTGCDWGLGAAATAAARRNGVAAPANGEHPLPRPLLIGLPVTLAEGREGESSFDRSGVHGVADVRRLQAPPPLLVGRDESCMVGDSRELDLADHG